jgi:adenosylmethionine-8-amino-7-oxononanoate aminotransferase
LMVGIELAKSKTFDLSAPYPPHLRMGLKVCDASLKRGVWLRPLGDVVVLMPPLAFSKTKLNLIRGFGAHALDEVTLPQHAGASRA